MCLAIDTGASSVDFGAQIVINASIKLKPISIPSFFHDLHISIHLLQTGMCFLNVTSLFIHIALVSTTPDPRLWN